MLKYTIISRKKMDALVEARAEALSQSRVSSQQWDILRKQTNIAMLQAQINPHFLYNTLECIRGQALSCNVPEIAYTAKALSEYFRYSISLHEDIVSLREEIINIRNYIYIQKYRFGDRFNLEIELDDSDLAIRNAALPKLTLQPLVENSVLHGFAKRTMNSAVIRITVERTECHINIHVIDNGLGMDQKTLRGINDLLGDERAQQETPGSGIALLNVHRRINLLFGKEYGLSISSAEGIGTDVEIHIPRRTPEEMRVQVV